MDILISPRVEIELYFQFCSLEGLSKDWENLKFKDRSCFVPGPVIAMEKRLEVLYSSY